MLAASGSFDGLTKPGAHIARVTIDGTIVEDRELLKMLSKIEEEDDVKAVMLSINSPGGTTAGGEAIYDAVRKISEKKPVVTSVKTLAGVRRLHDCIGIRPHCCPALVNCRFNWRNLPISSSLSTAGQNRCLD